MTNNMRRLSYTDGIKDQTAFEWACIKHVSGWLGNRGHVKVTSGMVNDYTLKERTNDHAKWQSERLKVIKQPNLNGRNWTNLT